MYQTVKTSTSIEAVLGLVGERGVVGHDSVNPVLCICASNTASDASVVASCDWGVLANAGFAGSSETDLRSGRSKRVAGHASVEQLIAAR